MNDNDTAPAAHVWPTLVYTDARAAIRFLVDAFGFAESLVVPNDTDDAVVEHAQLTWPEGGGVMLGSANRPGNRFSQRPTGVASVYVVTSDPDAVHDRAIAHGAAVFSPLVEHDYGGRGFSVTDLEGNIWSFGSYGGEPA
ncbi:MAG: VOC family protein [Acidimicrobiales bacterium]